MSDSPYSVVIIPLQEEDGSGYLALVPELYGCMAHGSTRQEAVSEVASAICEWLDEAKALGREVPKPGHIRNESARVRAAMKKVIKLQDELIDKLQASLEAATSSLTALQEKDQVEFGWDFECVDVELPSGKKALVNLAH